MVRFAALVSVLILASPTADAKCAMQHLAPKVLTDGPIATGGGFVVAEVDGADDARDSVSAAQPTWTLAAGGTKAAPKLVTLAPGLVVYRVEKAGETSLVDGTTVLATATAGAPAGRTLPAPKVNAIRHEKTLGRRASAFTRVTLAEPPPDGALALVLTDANGKARSFGLVDEDDLSVITVYAHSRCGVVPNKTVESSAGQRVKLFWVDRSGRSSPTSKLVTIAGKINDQGD